jgi:hypothetical protein
MSQDRTPEDEAETFAGQLPREIEPPAGLEERVVAGLRSAGALRPAPRRWTARDLVAAAAVFLAGLTVGAYLLPDNSHQPNRQPRFLLLLYPNDPAQPTQIGEDALAREYGAWAAGLRGSGRMVTGDRLAGEPRMAVGGADARSLDTTLQGFFIVGADSLDEAARLAEASPHVRHGGRVVVRAIDTP